MDLIPRMVTAIVLAMGVAGATGVSRAAAPATQATTPAEGVVTRLYDVSDLIGSAANEVAARTLAQVQDEIVAAVEPESWGENGPGSIRQVEGKSLAITHTPAAHRQIAQLLQEQREERPVSVAVETQFLAIPTSKIPAELLDPATKQFRGAYLSPKQVKTLVQVAQSVAAVPRVTVSDGGQAIVEVSTETKYTDIEATTRPNGTMEYKTKPATTWDGVKLDVVAKVSKDRKYIRLRLQPVLQKLLKIESAEFKPEGKDQRPIQFQQPMLQTIDVSTDVNVPDGQYLCLGGQTIAGEVEGKGSVESTLLVLVRAQIVTTADQAGAKRP